eukprot:gene34982-21140_t
MKAYEPAKGAKAGKGAGGTAGAYAPCKFFRKGHCFKGDGGGATPPARAVHRHRSTLHTEASVAW